MASIMKITIWVCIAVIVAAVVGLRIWPSGESPVRSIEDYAATRLIEPEEWVGIAKKGGLAGTGWVLLPKPSGKPEFLSNIRPAARGFLKPEDCGKCHSQNFQGFMKTAHAVTSALPASHSILGSFADGKNTFVSADARLRFRMTSINDRFYQELHVEEDQNRYEFKQAIDLVLGSGNHGQSYLWWQGDRLYQMHVSYLSETGQWVNSPGMYVDGTADFARPVPGRCLDCHATWFGEDPKEINRFDRHNFILGVTCVRCHGPGHEHAAYHQETPGAAEGQLIVNPARLSRDRLNDLCAQCHSSGEPLRPAFSYRPGEHLAEFLELDLAADDPGNDDPHSANQLARLMRSRCYINSDTMSCITCHDPHRDQRGQFAEYAEACRKCHQPEACGERNTLGDFIDRRCIECHMPSKRDQQVRVDTGTGSVAALLRDHAIGIWPEATEKVRAESKKSDVPDTPNNAIPEQPPTSKGRVL